MPCDEHLERWMHREGLGLLTDFYQLTMMGGYWKSAKTEERACFEYYFRDLPPHTGYAVFAGLEQLLDYLEHLRFSEQDMAYLRSLSVFEEGFLRALGELRFTGDVHAVAEGTPVFPNEPIVRVEAPLMEAQLLETFVLNALNYQTLIATKAARICQAANGEPVLEFGLRRAQGPDGGLCGARAAYLGGCEGTSNVLAGRMFGVPVRGTLAHSWVMSFPDELTAFRKYAEAFPDNCTLLVDTYDTMASGVPNAIRVFQELRRTNPELTPAIRLDSGDLARLSKQAHRMFVEAGFENPLIYASGDLDEDLIADLKRQGARINGWGVGTHLITSKDYPALGGIYKLVAIQSEGSWHSRIKISSNPAKTTDPGIKRVMRCWGADDEPLGDVLIGQDEPLMSGPSVRCVDRLRFYERRTLTGITRCEELLACVIRDGRRAQVRPTLNEIRGHAQRRLAELPQEYRRLRNPHIYTVALSPALAETKRQLLEKDWGS